MEKSISIKEIAKALLLFHQKVGKVKKDSANPFFKSKYASLSAILDVVNIPLQESGLSFTQFPTGQHELTTLLMHGESGEYIQDTFLMKPVKDDPQGLGSSITYQRRYALGAVLGLNIDEDDDGNAASTPSKKKAEPEKTSSTHTVELTDDAQNELLDKFKKEVQEFRTATELKVSWNDMSNKAVKQGLSKDRLMALYDFVVKTGKALKEKNTKNQPA